MSAYKTGDIIPIEELIEVCGHFEWDTNINNGYGCRHRSNEDKITDDKGRKLANCYSFTCPIACEICTYEFTSPEDLKLDKEDLAKAGLDPEDECYKEEGRWMHIFKLTAKMKRINKECKARDNS